MILNIMKGSKGGRPPSAPSEYSNAAVRSDRTSRNRLRPGTPPDDHRADSGDSVVHRRRKILAANTTIQPPISLIKSDRILGDLARFREVLSFCFLMFINYIGSQSEEGETSRNYDLITS